MTAAGQHRDTGREERGDQEDHEDYEDNGDIMYTVALLHEDGDAGHHDDDRGGRDDSVDGEVEEGGLVEMTMITVETGTDIILCRPVLTRPSRSRHHAARAWPRHSHYTWKRTFSQSRRRPLLFETSY